MITKIRLKNYRQYKDATMEFPAAVIGIIGSNGQGKSHLFEGISFGLTGTTVADTKKEDLLRWGSNGKGFVQLEFIKYDKPGTIYRELHSTKAWMTYDDDPKITGISNVDARVKELLNIDRDLCHKALFVPQDDLAKVLFDRPAERIKAWQRLCGMFHTEKIHKYLGDVISQMPEQADFTMEKEGTYSRLCEVRTRIVNLIVTGRSLRAQTGGAEFTQVKARYDDFKELMSLLATGEADTNALNTAIQTRDLAKTKLVEMQTKLGSYKTLEEYDKIITYCTRAIAQINSAEQQKQQLANLQQQFNDVQTRYAEAANRQNTEYKGDAAVVSEPEQVAQGIIDECKATLADLTGQINMRRALISAMAQATAYADEQPVCPLCESPITGVEDLRLKVTAKLKELEDAMRDANDNMQRMDTVVTSHQQVRADITNTITNAKAQLETLQQSIDSIKPQEASESLEQMQGTLTQANTERAARVAIETDIAVCKTKHQTADSDCAVLTTKLNELNAKAMKLIETNGFDISNLAEEQTKADTLLSVFNELNQITAAYKEAKEAAKKELAILRKIKQRESGKSPEDAARETLQRVRNWFHRNNGPREIVIEVLKRMVGTVNSFLEEFNSSFTVIPDEENVLFRVNYHDGRPAAPEPPPVSELSGGERVMLAVAFRFAGYYIFASQLGVMALDEPTRYLDKSKREMFCSVVERIKSLSKDLKLQVFISTHHEGLLNALDTVYTINNIKN